MVFLVIPKSRPKTGLANANYQGATPHSLTSGAFEVSARGPNPARTEPLKLERGGVLNVALTVPNRPAMEQSSTIPFVPNGARGEIPVIDVQRSALLLDIDGTLLDIAGRPEEVRVPSGLPDSLARLCECLGGALALVSGRRMATIDTLFAPMKFPAIGCHGAELRPSAAWGTAMTQAAPLEPGLRDRLASLAGSVPGVEIEDKTYTVALHYRQVPEIEDEIADAVAKICAEAPSGTVQLLRGKCVLEVKTSGFDKGTGVRALMTYVPFRGRRPVFVGDDVTDEDAFHALAPFGGLAISVGRAIDHSDYVLNDPKAVRAWLARMGERDCR